MSSMRMMVDSYRRTSSILTKRDTVTSIVNVDMVAAKECC